MIFHENRLPADEFLMKYHALFLKKRQNLKLSAHYRWRPGVALYPSSSGKFEH